MKLYDDIARCAGLEGDQQCNSCARKHQIERDEAQTTKCWYAYMQPKTEAGNCQFYIPERS